MNKCNKCGYDYSSSGDSAHMCEPIKIQQRTWQGMTDEEVKHEWEVWRANVPRYVGFAKGIEDKLKQKNGFAEEKNSA